MRTLFLFFLLLSSLLADQEQQLKSQIARMLILGFDEHTIDTNSKITKTLQKYTLGGVILFDRFYNDRDKVKNISAPKQVRTLTSQLQNYAQKRLFIAIDQEGGKVARLKERDGFSPAPSAASLASQSALDGENFYNAQSQMLQDLGINLNFAPVVDLALEPKNKVIYALERSYGKEPFDVAKFAKIMIDAQEKHNIISVLKHFPGHGSSLADSHEGFVDITHTWSEKELEPYKQLIQNGDAQMIMSAHVYNKKLDAKYPATLSHTINTKLLRQKLGFDGVLVSDDLQMKAISEHYSLKEAVTLAINSGVDMLLFGNQLAHNSADEIVNTIYAQVQNGAISQERITEANERIEHLITHSRIIQKPITFKQERIEMTKRYIQEHYALDVEDIQIKPQVIVLHWTAIMDFEKCFSLLEPEHLLSHRSDISDAGALNVSAHFLVKRDGSIYQLMPTDSMARHVIGLNYSSIGIENVGGEGNVKEDLTPAQVEANIALVKYLKHQYPQIEYLIGHHEYLEMQDSPLWLERDPNYRTDKADPGESFMKAVRAEIQTLGLKGVDE
jgi:beta-N-acetylhexosaminidase